MRKWAAPPRFAGFSALGDRPHAACSARGHRQHAAHVEPARACSGKLLHGMQDRCSLPWMLAGRSRQGKQVGQQPDIV